MDVDINKKMLCECARSLFSCCQSVGGAPPSLDMTLQEFIDSYGWNGVKFSVSDIKKQRNEEA